MIKIDMNMPNCCDECPFYSGFSKGTCLADEWNDLYFGNIHVDIERHLRCPLQEVEDE